MAIMKSISLAAFLYLVSLILSYFVVAYPYMSPMEVWDSGGSKDGGSIVFTFSVIFWLFSMVALKLTCSIISAIKKA